VSDLGTPISELPPASLTGTEIVPLVQSGGNFNTTLDDILALADTTIGLPEGYSVVPFTQDVLTDQTATMTAAMAELPDDTGGVVLIPAGTFYSRVPIASRSNLTFRGVTAAATTLVGPTASVMVEASGTSPRGYYTFEDITFDLSTSFAAMAIYPDDHDVTFRRCRFINISGRGVSCVGSINTTFEECEFDDGGSALGEAIECSSATRGLRWIRSKARFMSGGIGFENTPHDLIDIDGGLFDGGWYLLRTRPGGYTGSGGTVTYAATTVTDSAASFGDVGLGTNPAGINVRALPVLESGSTGTTYYPNVVNDAGATFVTNVVRPGYIVRTADKWAVVASVFSETKLYVEEWFDSTTYRPTVKPADDTAYTVYRVLIGLVSSNTATEITVERWFDFHDGASVTPANGTLYEVLINHGEYSGIHLSATTPHATGGGRRLRVHGGCHITRSWNDQLSVYGADARLVVEPSVLIDHGQDFGITSHSDQARIYGTVVHNGAVNIACTGADSHVQAFASGAPNVNMTNTVWLGDIVISGSRTRVSGSVVVASGALARHGIVIFGTAADGVVDSVDLSGASAHGYSVAEYRLYADGAAGITNTILRDYTGVLSSVNAIGTLDWVSSSEIQTTVGGAGGADALPATPTQYVKVTIDGTDYVIPAYDVS
jgi:hypothetical protein